jgi:predicted O-linked N-acetylglucosamine transferase (SPINDLY family)
MFNWFKKSTKKEKASIDLNAPAIRAEASITQQAISESEALKNQGNAHISNGKLQEAAECFRQAIARNPRFAEAYTNLGFVFQVQGNLGEAVTLYRKALECNPELLTAHQNLGFTLMSLGQSAAAEESLRRVVELAPEHAAALQSLGVIAAQRGDFVQAETLLRRALELQPDYADAHNNMGNMLMETKRLSEAEAAFRRTLELRPDFVDAYYNLGILLLEVNRLPEAEAAFRRALELKPDYAEAHCGLGNLFKQFMRLTEAEAYYLRALELNSNFAEAHNNLGNLLLEVKRFPEAEASYRRAIRLHPDLAAAHMNLGLALKELGRLDEAEISHKRALQIKPDSAEGYFNFGNTLVHIGRLEEAETNYRRALQIKPDYVVALSNLLFAMNYTSHNMQSYLEEARRYGRMVTMKAETHFSSWQCMNQPIRLRVGLVSGDMNQHSVGHFLEGLLLNINPASVELFAYPTHHKADALTERIKPRFAAWKPLFGHSDEAAARMIHVDGIHILIDLSGHTAYNRLPVFAWKPAPVQVTWLGLPSTTGMEEMDYILGDSIAIPTEFENQFSEKVWRMPESYVCLTVPAFSIDVVMLPALANGYFTFASFNNLTKMTDSVVTVWARILKSVPNSRLMLKTRQLSNPVVREKTRQRFAANGIASNQLLLTGANATDEDHLATYNRVDIALDTFPYPGVTTSVEALWMGVPVLSLRGDRFISRSAASIAHHAGLPDWVVADEDEYVAKAVAFAANPDYLTALRAGLRHQVVQSPLFNAPRFARNFENALWAMYENRLNS